MGISLGPYITAAGCTCTLNQVGKVVFALEGFFARVMVMMMMTTMMMTT